MLAALVEEIHATPRVTVALRPTVKALWTWAYLLEAFVAERMTAWSDEGCCMLHTCGIRHTQDFAQQKAFVITQEIFAGVLLMVAMSSLTVDVSLSFSANRSAGM